jgi:hypothetical protein
MVFDGKFHCCRRKKNNATFVQETSLFLSRAMSKLINIFGRVEILSQQKLFRYKHFDFFLFCLAEELFS